MTMHLTNKPLLVLIGTYMRNSMNSVTVFEDTGKGLKRTFYVKPASKEDVE